MSSNKTESPANEAKPADSPPPCLPPLYFDYKTEQNNIIQNKNASIEANVPQEVLPIPNSTTTPFAMEPFPSEILSAITSYLDWGDYARLSVTNKSFQTIVHDAAQSDVQTKWNLALALLNGTNGLQCHPKLAMRYLVDLAGCQEGDDEDAVRESFDPKFEPMLMKLSSTMDDDNDENSAKLEEATYSTMAMKKIANCYFTGNGVANKDAKLGLAWLKKAYLHGDIESAYQTALIYEYSKYDVEVDIYHAAEWFLGAANAGHVESMAEYAMCLELGCGVDANDDLALDWYTKAAEKGHITSNFSVGEMFEQARGGLPQSDTEAVLWYYKAALMGDEDSKKALVRLGDIARIVIPGWANTLNV